MIIPLASATPMALVILVLKKRVSTARSLGFHFLMVYFTREPIAKRRFPRLSLTLVLKHSEWRRVVLSFCESTAIPTRSNPGSIAKTILDCICVDVLDFVIVFEFSNKGF